MGNNPHKMSIGTETFKNNVHVQVAKWIQSVITTSVVSKRLPVSHPALLPIVAHNNLYFHPEHLWCPDLGISEFVI